MNELRLAPLTCPQCGAPGAVREGTRITACERCGVRLCLSERSWPRYEAVANLSEADSVKRARAWLEGRGQVGMLGRPELILVPYHETAGRRVGVFQRKVTVRKQLRPSLFPSQSGEPDDLAYTYRDLEDTKVMVSDVERLAPAARTRWDLRMFDATAARRTAQLRTFDLVEAQRRATVYAAEELPEILADESVTSRARTELVAVSRRTLFFPFWSIPVQTRAGSYEVVVEALGGKVVAWRLPEPFSGSIPLWATLAAPGALGLGQALRALLFGTATLDPVIGFTLGGILTAVALWRVNRPDWAQRTWPAVDTMARLERHAS